MNRDDLDAWFAEADDILTDWRPGTDAMTAHASAEPVDAPLPRADSYYEQPNSARYLQQRADLDALVEALMRPHVDDGSGVVTYEVAEPLFTEDRTPRRWQMDVTYDGTNWVALNSAEAGAPVTIRSVS